MDIGEERIPFGSGLFEFFKDANGRGYLYCTQCYEQTYIGDTLELSHAGRLRKWWWLLTHLRTAARVMWPHFGQCSATHDKGE